MWGRLALLLRLDGRSSARQVRYAVEHPDRLQDDVPDHLEALGAQLVHRVLRSVPERIGITVVQIDQVSDGNALLGKRNMVVQVGGIACEEMRLVSVPGSGLIDQIFQPRR